MEGDWWFDPNWDVPGLDPNRFTASQLDGKNLLHACDTQRCSWPKAVSVSPRKAGAIRKNVQVLL